jgi:hypothetical protein
MPARTRLEITKSKRDVAMAVRRKTSRGILIFFIKFPLFSIAGPHLLMAFEKKVQGTRAA